MSKRPPLPGSKPSDQSCGPPVLKNALESLGRTRGSSATPVQSGPEMISPQPQRDIQARIDSLTGELGQIALGQGNQSQHNISLTTRKAPKNPGQGAGGHQHRRGQSSTARFGLPTQTQSFEHGHHGDSGPGMQATVAPATFKFPTGGTPNQEIPRTPSQWAATFQRKLTELQQLISKTPDISIQNQEYFNREVQKIAQDFNEAQRSMQQEHDRLKKERDDFRRQLSMSKGDNSRLLQERKNVELKHQQSMERLRAAETRWKLTQEDLLQQLSVQEEQLAGKRALWMQANPGSSARRDAMNAIRDPFNSPTTNQTNYTGSVMGSMVSPLGTTPMHSSFGSRMLGPPPAFNNIAVYKAGGVKGSGFGGDSDLLSGHKLTSSSRKRLPHSNTGIEPRRGTLPTGGSLPAVHKPELCGYNLMASSHGVPGEPHPEREYPLSTSTALVVHKGHEELAEEYKVEVSKLYDLVEGWALNYSNEPNSKNDRVIATSNNVLWEYMMNATYPGHRQDAHTHVVALLGDSTTRYWFVMRMATQYCVNVIMSIEAFKPYSKRVETIITQMLLKLKERGLNNEARQRYIDQGCEAVQSVVTARDYQIFRAQQLNTHTKGMRDILGPMLNDDVVRSEAGCDLGAIAVHAWDLSVKMHTAGLTFQIYFPETASKFTAATMIPKDRWNADPMQLQIQQVRLKLVITPVITMRDDKGTTIRAKAIHSSHVLLMS